FGQLRTPVSLNRYTYGYANPLLYWDPDGRVGVVMDGAGAAITGFESDGTPIRAAVAQDRIDRHKEKIWKSEAPANLAKNQVSMPWEFDADQFGVTNPTPTTASQAAIAAANERVALAHDWAVLQEALTPGTVNMDPIDAECYTEGLGAMACMWDWGRAPSTLGATDFAIAMLAPLLIAQLPAIAGWAAG
ncbi:MAG: hypothetical protein GY788_23180, partial [bacterium]|nr:hypothetical protein [bacterium]